MKTIHYLSKEMSMFENKGVAACGTYINAEAYGDNMTGNREDVTCGNCLRSKIYKQTKDQQKCKHGKIVGCDMNGRKHKCKCTGAFIEVPDDRK